VDVQALVPQTPIERLDESILDEFPRTDEVELHVAAIHPALYALAATHTHAHLELLQTIQASNTIVIDPPAVTPEQHPDA
jgi:hypothetical protein